MDVIRDYARTLGVIAFAVLLGCTPETPNTPASSAVAEGADVSSETLVTRDLIAEFWPSTPDFAFRNVKVDGEIAHFAAELQFKQTDERQHYTIDVALAGAGRFIDPDAYQIRRTDELRSNPQAASDYPNIGLRAKREFFGAGPGGAAYGLTFTTADGRSDIRITVSNQLPENVLVENFDIDGFAQRIAKRYTDAAR